MNFKIIFSSNEDSFFFKKKDQISRDHTLNEQTSKLFTAYNKLTWSNVTPRFFTGDKNNSSKTIFVF